MNHHLTACLGLIAVLFSATACTPAPTVPEGPWAEDIRLAQAAASSDFEKEAFSDGVITRAEYVEGLDLYVACMADVGWEVGLLPQDDYFVYAVPGADASFDAPSDACMDQTIGDIEHIYVDMLQNPKNQPYWASVRDCLARGELDVPPSGDELDALAQGLTNGTTTSDDPDITACVHNPT